MIIIILYNNYLHIYNYIFKSIDTKKVMKLQIYFNRNII